MMFNWYDTKGMGTNWYEYVPETNPVTDVGTQGPGEVGPDTLTSYELEQLLRTQYGISPLQEKEDEDPGILRMRRRSQTGSMDLMNAVPIMYGDIKYTDFNSYLKTKGLPDRSGMFSPTEFPDSEKAKGGFVGLFEAKILGDPTGEYNRSIPQKGLFNNLASASISQEYDALGKIKNSWMENPDGTVQANGFAFNLGGTTIYREPGSNRYSGGLDRLGIDQRMARQVENMMIGRELGTQLLENYMGEGEIPFFADIAAATGLYSDGTDLITSKDGMKVNGFSFDDILLATKNGGYRLDGSFNFRGQVGRNGRMDDFDDLVEDVFNGNKEVTRDWLNTTRSTDFESAGDKIRNLQFFILQSRGFSKVEALNMVSTSGTAVSPTVSGAGTASTTTASTPSTPSAPAPQPTSGPTGDDRVSSMLESGATQFVNVPGVGFVSPERAAAIQRDRSNDRDDSAPAGRSYSLTREEVSTPSSSGDPRGYSMRALGGGVPSMEREPEGFIRGAPQQEGEEDSVVSRAEAERPAPESGFIVRPPSEVSDQASVADDIDMEPEVGGEVINASAVSMAGEKDIYEMIEDAKKYRKNVKGIDKPVETSNIKISAGEVYVDPELADIIGRDKIRKINERGIPATKKKQQRSQRASRGGKVS